MKPLVRYAFYPLTLGLMLVTALAAASGVVAPWPTLPVVVALAIGAIAWLERQFPFEPAWLADQGDLHADIVHALVNWGLLSGAGWATHLLVKPIWGASVWPQSWPVAAQLLLVALVLDLGLYAMHWISHRWSWAWRLHAVHHSAERLYWLNGERRHPASALLMGAPGLLLLACIGTPPLLVSAWLAVIAVHLAFQHANLDYRLGPLRRWIAGAETHRWHHKREYEDAQVNFGEFFLLWDRLFGTLLDAGERLAPNAVGLRGRSAPARYLQQLAWPFRCRPRFGMRSSSSSTRDDGPWPSSVRRTRSLTSRPPTFWVKRGPASTFAATSPCCNGGCVQVASARSSAKRSALWPRRRSLGCGCRRAIRAARV